MAKFVLIDDDPLFGNIMVRVAKSRGADIDYFPSLLDMGSVGCLGQYDAAIVDYDLGNMTGVEIAEYLKVFFGDIPMVLVSSRHRDIMKPKSWPDSVRCFVHKSAGYEAILSEALTCIASNVSAASIVNSKLSTAIG